MKNDMIGGVLPAKIYYSGRYGIGLRYTVVYVHELTRTEVEGSHNGKMTDGYNGLMLVDCHELGVDTLQLRNVKPGKALGERISFSDLPNTLKAVIRKDAEHYVRLLGKVDLPEYVVDKLLGYIEDLVDPEEPFEGDIVDEIGKAFWYLLTSANGGFSDREKEPLDKIKKIRR